MKRYKNAAAERDILLSYDKVLAVWDTPAADTDVDTFCGNTHVITCGNKTSPPLVLFHGAGDDSALMWIYNAPALAQHFRVYAVDTIGGPGKSRPNGNYVRGFDSLRWLDELLDGLGIERTFIAGVSSGGLIAQHYGIMRPNRVPKMICMSRTDIMSSTGKNPILRMLKVFMPEAAFPTDQNIVRLIKKLAGGNYERITGNPVLLEHYRHLLKGYNNMAMACHKKVTFTEKQLLSISGRSLFLFGEADPLGDAAYLRRCLEANRLDYRFFPGVGHLINHEIAQEINGIMVSYFIGDTPNGGIA